MQQAAEDARIRLLRRCCVLIPGRGTGFFLGPQHVLTCAHVVPGRNEGDKVTLCLEDGQQHAAAILRLTSPIWPDIALLKIETHSHDIQVRFGRELGLGDPLYAFGFPIYGSQQRADGMEGEFEGVTWRHLTNDNAGTSWPALPLIKFKESLVVQGFSGSPLLNLRTCEVVGVVSESLGRSAAVGGWAIPASAILETFSDVADQTAKRHRVYGVWDKALQEAADRIAPPPWLTYRPPFERFHGKLPAHRSGREATRFLPSTQRTGFHGRLDELAALRQFLDAPRDFAWCALVGSGGAGKSRIAHRLLQKVGDDWGGGFLERRALSDARWEEWRPLRPTLIVIDDADTGDTRDVRAFTAALARRAATPSRSLGWPVRLLLLGRNGDFMASRVSDVESARIAESRHGDDDHVLGPMGSTALAELVLDLAPSINEKGVDGILSEVARIDPETRPLYAQFVAEAVQDGLNPASWNRADLLQHVLGREREMRWDPAEVTDDDRLVVALGTLCAPLTTAGLTTAAKMGFPVEAKLDSRRKRRIGTMLGLPPVATTIPSLQPDILGTMFVLNELQQLSGDDPELHGRCIAVAWELQPDGVRTAARRAVEEFIDHPETAALLSLAPDAPAVLQPWADAAAFAVQRRHPARHPLLEQLAERYSSSRDASVLDDLWSAARSIIGEATDERRVQHDRLWNRLMALPLPHHSLLAGRSFSDVGDNRTLLANLPAVFAIWGVKATEAGRRLYFAHRRAKDRGAAKAIVRMLAGKASLLSSDCASNFDGNWLEYMSRRRVIVRQRALARTYRPTVTGGRPVTDAIKGVIEYALDKGFFLPLDWISHMDFEEPDAMEVLRLQIGADIEFCHMLAESESLSWSRRYVDALSMKLQSVFMRAEGAALKAEFEEHLALLERAVAAAAIKGQA